MKEISLSSKVIKRFLSALLENGKMKKTTLAGRAGINYTMCIKYATFLVKIGWIEMRIDNNMDDDVHEYLSLTPQGRQIIEVLNSDDNTTYVSNNNVIAQGEVDVGKKIERRIRSNNHPKIHSSVQNDKTQGSSSTSFLTSTTPSTTQFHQSGKSLFINRKSKKNIMIIDDDSDILLTYEAFLNSCGYNVKTFSDPIEALKHFAEDSSSYDLLILDIRMPQVNGIQLFQTFKSINRNIKVMFVSCLDSAPELVSIFPEVKQDEVLAKPITAEHFVNAVKRILN
jgi:CheY-like chemotaxis protein/predicted transcriptional regulator